MNCKNCGKPIRHTTAEEVKNHTYPELSPWIHVGEILTSTGKPFSLFGCSNGNGKFAELPEEPKPASPLAPGTYTFTGNEIATILHGLRMIQENANGHGDCMATCCDHFDGFDELNDAEIDALCERINPLDADATKLCDNCGETVEIDCALCSNCVRMPKEVQR